MASRADDPGLFGPRMWGLVWLPIAAISVLHYVTSPSEPWIHDVLRRLYYLPIVVAAFQAGLRASVGAAIVVTLSYLPHGFGHRGHLEPYLHTDPAGGVQKLLEILLYHVVAVVSGYLADLGRRRQKQLEDALDQRHRLERQLIRAGRLGALGEVVAGIAHEIKNPLHALRGTAEVVDPVVPRDCPERRMWELHVSELDRLDRVSDRFLSFASPQPLSIQPLDLREVADRLVALIEAEARNRNIQIDLDRPSQPIPVRADRDQLAQVGLNIALNAVKAIGERGGRIRVRVGTQVSVSTRRDEPATMALLRIENDGPAIAEAEREHLFDPFHSGSGESTGLGLSVASRIVDQHGGSIEIDAEGLGVGFKVLLPLIDGPSR